MTPEERNLVIELFDRLATLEDAQRDPEAERLIRDGLRQAPNASYALVQTVLVQDETSALNLYRIAQEAVANAVQHGEPKELRISLTRDRRGITLSIRDSGKGMSATTGYNGLGIHIMKYRANTVGGSLTVDSKPNDGTTITCHVPSR